MAFRLFCPEQWASRGFINSDREHDWIERAWTAAPEHWAPAEGVDELRIRLGEITDLIQAAGETALLEVVSGQAPFGASCVRV